jgi:hypothetical protein
MGRKHSCKICTSDPAISSQVNALIESSVRQRMIHEQHPQFSVSQISRHTRNCIMPTVPDLAVDAGADDMDVWRQRCNDAYNLAVANGDSRSAIAACSAATRQLIALSRRKEQEAKAAKDDIDRDTAEFTIKGCDAMLAEYAKLPEDFRAIDARAVQLLGDQHFRQLVSQIWEHRDLLPLALAAATPNCLPERKMENVQPTN